MSEARVLDILRRALPPADYAAIHAWSQTFYPFQRRWLFEPSRFALCCKSRQIGFSHTTAGWATLRAACFGETTTVISVGEREAIEVLKKSAKHADVLASLGSTWARASSRGETLSFPNTGGAVIALPASSGGRSYSGNVVLDEFGYLEGRAAPVWDSAAAVILHGYAIRVLSTPNGVGNEWYELWSNDVANKGYAKHEVTIEDAIADGMRVDLDECWKMAKGDPRLFDQLFRCKFLDGSEQYLPTKSILEAVVDDATIYMGESYAGLDIGLTNDLTSLYVVRQSADNMCWIQDSVSCRRTDWDEQEAMIARSFEKHQWRRLCVDATGLGAIPAQRLQKQYGLQRVEPINFTQSSKESLATLLYQAFADGMVRMTRDEDLIRDLCSIKRLVTATGAVRYDADRNSRGHADRAWALALALHACANRPTARHAKAAGDFENT